MQIIKPPLPYGIDGLAPVISSGTMDIHYNVLMQAYIDKLNDSQSVQNMPDSALLEDIMFLAGAEPSSGDMFSIPQGSEYIPEYNLAAQVWNHQFFWNCLAPMGDGVGGEPYGAIADIIRINYGNWVSFREKLRTKALSSFGSGWLWLAINRGSAWILTGRNAANPLIYGMTPVFTIDMWEHSYFMDYGANRALYFDKVMDHLINWKFVNEMIEKATF